MASNFSSHYPSRLSYYPDLSTLPVGHSNVSASLRDSNHGYAGKIEMAYNRYTTNARSTTTNPAVKDDLSVFLHRS